jgi:RNA polymerase sigma factor (sigma-70 family)
MNRILSRLTRVAVEPASPSDGRLLDAFLSERSGPAFASLVERHGPMVLAVCNRVLRHRQDAEDAFQATFLVLVRRAADVRPRDAVGSWLYGVAYRVALKARALRARRLVREQPLGERPTVAPVESPSSDLAEAIDRALGSLPQSYRAAVVACDLEGLSRADAASRLGWKEGTLSGRLARARQLLAERLRKAGIALPAGGIVAVTGTGDAVAAELAAETVRLAVESCGKTLASGASAPVVALTEGVVRGMFLAKIKVAAVTVLVASTIGFGVWASARVGNGQGAGKGPGDQRVAGTQTREKQAAKRHPDLEAMQGTWWILAIGDGNKLETVDPNAQRDPRQFALTIRDDQCYFPNHPAFRKVLGVGKITLDPTKTPKQIDIAHEGGTFPGVYEFAALTPKDDVIQLRLSLPPPGAVRSAGFQKGGLGAVEVILGRFADPLRDPAGNAGLAPGGANVDLTVAEERLRIAHEELADVLKWIKDRDPAKDLDDFERLLHQDQERVNAVLQLLDRAEAEMVKARLRTKPAPKLPDPPPKAPGEKPALDLDVARGNLMHARKYLADTLKDQQDREKSGDWPVETPDELAREIARFRADVETLERLLKSSQTALDAARAAGPAAKMPGDLVRMQGRWRVDTLWDGKQQRPIPAKDAPFYEFVGNKLYGPFRESDKKEDRPQYTIVLRPEKTPPEIDLTIPSRPGPLLGIYRFPREWEPRGGNLWLSVSNNGPRPTSFDGKDRPPGAVIELTRVADDKPKSGVVEGVDLKPAEQRRELALQELQLLLLEDEHASKLTPTTLQQYADRLERQKARLGAIQKLLDEAQKEFDKEKERVKPAAPPKPAGTPGPGNPIDDAKARREIERQRARVLLDQAKTVEAAAQTELRLATAGVRQAEVKLEEAKAQLAAAQKAFDEFATGREPGVVVRDANNKERAPTEEQASHIRTLASALVASSTGELTGGKGKPFATAELWEKLEESGHVAVTFADARTFKGVADHPEVVVEAILIPIAPDKRPDFVLVRRGNTYRALFGFRDEDEAALRTLLSKLK